MAASVNARWAGVMTHALISNSPQRNVGLRPGLVPQRSRLSGVLAALPNPRHLRPRLGKSRHLFAVAPERRGLQGIPSMRDTAQY